MHLTIPMAKLQRKLSNWQAGFEGNSNEFQFVFKTFLTCVVGTKRQEINRMGRRGERDKNSAGWRQRGKIAIRAGKVANGLWDCCPGSCTAGGWKTFHCNLDLSLGSDDITQKEIGVSF